jgi:hypothetical protein
MRNVYIYMYIYMYTCTVYIYVYIYMNRMKDEEVKDWIQERIIEAQKLHSYAEVLTSMYAEVTRRSRNEIKRGLQILNKIKILMIDFPLDPICRRHAYVCIYTYV